tara:strand:+ start:1419 stop:1586 length:168 start_codon:yes stop_codon:yes gene_type:complete
MEIKIIKKYSYVVRYYSKDGKKIGYETCSEENLQNILKTKVFCGKEVSHTEYNRR